MQELKIKYSEEFYNSTMDNLKKERVKNLIIVGQGVFSSLILLWGYFEALSIVLLVFSIVIFIMSIGVFIQFKFYDRRLSRAMSEYKKNALKYEKNLLKLINNN